MARVKGMVVSEATQRRIDSIYRKRRAARYSEHKHPGLSVLDRIKRDKGVR